MKHNKTIHQQKQITVINEIIKQVNSGSLKFSIVEPVDDFTKDQRICLTSVHFPKKDLLDRVSKIIEPLKKISPQYYYYPQDALHLTIKNIRVISDPPSFNRNDIVKVQKVFSQVIPAHKTFRAYFYRLLLFPSNLALIGTTDPELDDIHLKLDKRLKEIGIPDDKIYTNNKYFFCNMTLARFNSKPSSEFVSKVAEISDSLTLPPYIIDSVTLIKANASLSLCHKIHTWNLPRRCAGAEIRRSGKFRYSSPDLLPRIFAEAD